MTKERGVAMAPAGVGQVEKKKKKNGPLRFNTGGREKQKHYQVPARGEEV